MNWWSLYPTVPDSDEKRHNWVVGIPKRETNNLKHIPVQADEIANNTHYQILNDTFYSVWRQRQRNYRWGDDSKDHEHKC